ncbi:MAG: hypothetical protein V3T31_05210 [candidate division Zixibacteria bacterium]
MQPKLHYDLRDILAVPARALSAKQILIMTVGLIIALIFYNSAYYLAHLLAGSNLTALFAAKSFLPSPLSAPVTFWSGLLIAMGIVMAILTIMLSSLATAAINVERIRGNRFMTFSDGIRYALSRWRQIALAEIGIILFILFAVLLFVIAGLLGRIPYLGEWIYAAFFLIPAFFSGLFTVLVITVLVVSTVIMPAVAAVEMSRESFDLILETFSVIIRQPFRWLGYSMLLLLLAKVGSFIYAYAAFRTVQFMTAAVSISDSGRMHNLIGQALGHLPVDYDLVYGIFNLFPGIDFGVNVMQYATHTPSSAAAYLLSAMLFLILASIAGYAMNIIAVGQAYAYIIICNEKDALCINDAHCVDKVTPPRDAK